jgi:hypothetical protein
MLSLCSLLCISCRYNTAAPMLSALLHSIHIGTTYSSIEYKPRYPTPVVLNILGLSIMSKRDIGLINSASVRLLPPTNLDGIPVMSPMLIHILRIRVVCTRRISSWWREKKINIVPHDYNVQVMRLKKNDVTPAAWPGRDGEYQAWRAVKKLSSPS